MRENGGVKHAIDIFEDDVNGVDAGADADADPTFPTPQNGRAHHFEDEQSAADDSAISTFSTFSAVPDESDHRIAVASKLPETARLPSGETATARTGPPWPRSWAMAGIATAQSARSKRSRQTRRGIKLGSGHCRAD